MSRVKENKAALDLWEQVLSRLSERDDAALWRPDDHSEDFEGNFREALRKAGWSDEEAQARIEIEREVFSRAPVTSPGLNPGAEFILEKLRSDIEDAMERLSLRSHSRVALGIEPRVCPYATKVNVTMTEESIVTVGVHLFRFCGLIARALIRSLYLNPFFWDGDAYVEAAGRQLLRGGPGLMRYWMHIYLSYALTGTNVLVPFQPATKAEALPFEQIARAMELFAIAHEYGHHNFNHGRQLNGEAHAEEFEADQFALRICYEIEQRPFIFPNPYLSSGAGGVALLLALETLRTVEDRLGLGEARGESLHPSVRSRVRRLDFVAVLRPEECKSLWNFRAACDRILTAVHSELITSLKFVSPQTLADVRREFQVG